MIRAYGPEDAAGVAALIEDTAPPLYGWKLHRLHGPDRDDGGWRRTRVATGPDGGITGAVTVARNRVHTGQYTLVVTVAPGHRRQGLGRALVAQGRRLRAGPSPLVVQLYESDVAGMACSGRRAEESSRRHRPSGSTRPRCCRGAPRGRRRPG